MRLCFLVNVRKARGRNIAGGRTIGRMVDLDGALLLNGLRGCAGVAKAGEEDGMGFEADAFAIRQSKKIEERLSGD